MTTVSLTPGVDTNVFFLIVIGLGAGILSGFTGVGGALIVVPALIILGFPASFAVGTSLTWVMGNSVVGAFSHGKLGNVDAQLGLVMSITAIGGVEVGVRIVNWLKDIGLADDVILSISVCMLLVVGIYILLESMRRKRYLDELLAKGEKPPPVMRGTSFSQKIQSINIPPRLHFAKSEATMSLWIMLAVGSLIGLLVGTLGIGGGFIMVPALVYVIGLPSFVAIGTSLFQIIFSAAYGSIRHTMSGNVIIFVSFIMIIASSIGVQFGALVSRYVRGVSVRLILGITILVCAIGAILKLLNILQEAAAVWLQMGSLAAILGGIGVVVIVILVLFIMAICYRHGRSIPTWIESFVAKRD